MLRRVGLAFVLLLGACSDDSAPESVPEGRVRATVGSSGPLVLEVADTAEERAVGLMRRTSVPPGTGMLFVYDQPENGRYYMYDVPVPLTAVFARAGRVVFVVDMPPCREQRPQDCPTYGPDEPFDRVVETAPETLAGKVRVGDRLVVEG